jgi:hypothetical protein
MKNSNDTIGNRTSDLPACSAVPQTTTLRCAAHQNTRVVKTCDFYVTSISMKHSETDFSGAVHPVNQHEASANRIP